MHSDALSSWQALSPIQKPGDWGCHYNHRVSHWSHVSISPLASQCVKGLLLVTDRLPVVTPLPGAACLTGNSWQPEPESLLPPPTPLHSGGCDGENENNTTFVSFIHTKENRNIKSGCPLSFMKYRAYVCSKFKENWRSADCWELS